MHATSTISAFHHWLLDEPLESTDQKYVLVIGGAVAHPHLCSRVAHHLNQFDEHGSGRWLAATPSLIEAIASDPHQRRLLGVEEPCPQCPPISACGLRKVMKVLSKRGHVVLDSAHAQEATKGMANVFRVILGDADGEWHVRINPTLFPNACLAPIIGDIYMEWLDCRCSNKIK